MARSRNRRNNQRRSRRVGGGISEDKELVSFVAKKQSPSLPPVAVVKPLKKAPKPIVRTIKVDNVSNAKNIPKADESAIIAKVNQMANIGWEPEPNTMQGALREFRTPLNPNEPIHQRERFYKLLEDKRKYSDPSRSIPAVIGEYSSPYVLPRPGLPNDLPKTYGYRNNISTVSQHELPIGRLGGAQPQW